jgi:hypothetical protein
MWGNDESESSDHQGTKTIYCDDVALRQCVATPHKTTTTTWGNTAWSKSRCLSTIVLHLLRLVQKKVGEGHIVEQRFDPILDLLEDIIDILQASCGHLDRPLGAFHLDPQKGRWVATTSCT